MIGDAQPEYQSADRIRIAERVASWRDAIVLDSGGRRHPIGCDRLIPGQIIEYEADLSD